MHSYREGGHWGFGAAAVGMLAGLALYLFFRAKYLGHIGEPTVPEKGRSAPMFMIGSIVLAGVFALLFHTGIVGSVWESVQKALDFEYAEIIVPVAMLTVMIGLCAWFTMINRPEDRGPVASIFIFMFFNAFFWIAFEQAGSSVNLFTDRYVDRSFNLFGWKETIDTPVFQSVNAALIILCAPLFGVLWSALGRRNMNPSQPVKIALGLMLLGVGYICIFLGARSVSVDADGLALVRASMLTVIAMYFWHTMGELCLSPTGLSYVTKVAPVRFVSLLMGIWFISSFIAGLGGGLLAAQVNKIDSGEVSLPWNFSGQNANFFFLFVVTSFASGLLILIASPWLKKLAKGRE